MCEKSVHIDTHVKMPNLRAEIIMQITVLTSVYKLITALPDVTGKNVFSSLFFSNDRVVVISWPQ